jgi:3-phenylpropionate/trans-cinnamate dioxygenase ferredoxin reductase subunit
VGAGQGGAQVAIALRQKKYSGSVVLIGDEAALPYERPALSKEYLAGERSLDKLALRPGSYWEEHNITMRLGQRVTDVDSTAHRLRISDGSTLEYGKLVWATGGRPRQLACNGNGASGIHYVRHIHDIDRMRAELETSASVVVIGGGYIGLEVAAVLRKQGKQVTVLEAQDRVLARVAGVDLARFFATEHRCRGVDLRLGVVVTCIEATEGRVTGVRLDNGEVIPADLVVVGIGIQPTVEPLLAAGAGGASGDGVLVDLHGKTSLPDVFAVGDCAAHANVHANGRIIRLESIQNANDQAMIVAKSILGVLGAEERYDAIPWFWSTQYDLRLQTVGLWLDHDDVVVRGDPNTKSFSVAYLRAGRVIALDCVNLTKDYVQGKALISSAREVDRAKLARPDIMLKEL